MNQTITQIQKQLVAVVLLGFAITPICSYAVGILFGLVSTEQLMQTHAGYAMLGAYILLLAGTAYYFYNFTQPLLDWYRKHPKGQTPPNHLKAHLARFTSRYWLFYLAAIVLYPILQLWFTNYRISRDDVIPLSEQMLLMLVISIYAGMPGYLFCLNRLGHLNRFIDLNQVQIKIQTKMLIIGGFLPLLTSLVLLKYFWWKTGYVSVELVVSWLSIGLIGFLITGVAIYNLNQSLSPVRRLIDRNGAISNHTLAKMLRPQSLDEIGYLVRMLGDVFHRLVNQKAHVSAIVDHAAEGIIVLTDEKAVDTFNPAAERLFGYLHHEMKGKPIRWLIPELNTDTLNNDDPDFEHELIGRNRNGSSVPIRVRCSRMQRDGQNYFTLIVADISEQQAAQQQLLAAESRYRSLVETAHDLVWSIDTKGRWSYLNNAVLDIYGCEQEEMLHQPFTLFQAPESKERDAIAFGKLLDGKELVQYETVHLNKDGQPRYISFNARPVFDANNKVTSISGTARDITEQKIFEKELTYQAQHDNLTGLHNRSYFNSELERVISRIARSAAECALLYLDLDQFKYVNDTLGHAAGDRLLKECTELLRKNIREGDLLARFGGDEFTIILYNIDHDHAMPVAENIRSMFEHYRFNDSSQSFNVTCSIGMTMIDSNTKSAEDALSRADIACNISKSQGRNCVHEYTEEDSAQSAMAEDMGWAQRVRDAIENDQFKLLYQPIVRLESETVHGYEVLLRLPTEDGQFIKPGGFIPAAERFGLIHNLDRWAVRNAMEYLAELHSDNFETHFAINLSGRAVEDKKLLNMIKGILSNTGLNPASLTFEITETTAINNLQAARRFIGQLKDLGCRMSLDDFGSGFCSFTYLKHLPVDSLKIDGSFVQGLTLTEIDQAMVMSMNQIAHALGKTTIAEFVENRETLMMLKEIGIDFAQGHYLGRPDHAPSHSSNSSIIDTPLSA